MRYDATHSPRETDIPDDVIREIDAEFPTTPSLRNVLALAVKRKRARELKIKAHRGILGRFGIFIAFPAWLSLAGYIGTFIDWNNPGPHTTGSFFLGVFFLGIFGTFCGAIILGFVGSGCYYLGRWILTGTVDDATRGCRP